MHEQLQIWRLRSPHSLSLKKKLLFMEQSFLISASSVPLSLLESGAKNKDPLSLPTRQEILRLGLSLGNVRQFWSGRCNFLTNGFFAPSEGLGRGAKERGGEEEVYVALEK